MRLTGMLVIAVGLLAGGYCFWTQSVFHSAMTSGSASALNHAFPHPDSVLRPLIESATKQTHSSLASPTDLAKTIQNDIYIGMGISAIIVAIGVLLFATKTRKGRGKTSD